LGIGIPKIVRVDANDAYAAENRGERLKLIMRADDMGYSNVGNIGTFKCMDNGVITSADVMLDSPGTVDALERLRNYPWISVGWHGGHQWGWPVADPKKIASLLDERGRFKWGIQDGRKLGGVEVVPTTEEIKRRKNNVVYEEALLEFRSEVERCVKVLGKAPDTTGSGSTATLVDKARKQVCDEFGIKYNWFTKGPGSMGDVKLTGASCDPEYAHLNIFMPDQNNGTNKYMLDPPGKDKPELYDVVAGFRSDSDGIKGHKIVQCAFHPMFVDDYIARDGGYFQFNMNRIRVMDVYYMCCQELKDWIKENKIELVNQRDALYGTCQYQNHLRDIGSDLYMRG
jgi:predicted glycoside hydrolase/deacetylase ChbG (UPF0249 family)